MKIFEGCLLVSDLDGSFFGSGTSLPQRNLDAVRYFMDNGGLFTIATGRSITAAKKIAKDIPKNVPAILFNGAMLYDFASDRVLYDVGIETPNAKNLVVQTNKQFPQTQCVIFHERKLYCTTHNYQTAMADSLCMKSIYEPDVDKIAFPWYKVLFGGQPEELLTVLSFLREMKIPDLVCLQSSAVLLEVLRSDVNKGTGLVRLAQMLRIPLCNTFALGDYYNDEQLLKTAGHSFLPQNAAEDLKHLGIVVCDHTLGAVADVVERIQQMLESEKK